MEYLKLYSERYANGVTSLSAVGAMILAIITLTYLKREYSSKYRPYVFPGVHVEPISGGLNFNVTITPKNVGTHPCKVKLTSVSLNIGDETYDTPDMKEWLLLPPAGIGKVLYPAGFVNEQGVTSIREGRCRNNRIELDFEMQTVSMENKYEEKICCAYEIDVRSEHPLAFLRPEWIVNS